MECILKKGEVMLLAAAARPAVRVKEGIVWLTRAEDSRDYFLQRGDSFAMNGEGSVVLEALADCAFDIQCPDVAPWQVIIQLTLKGPQKVLSLGSDEANLAMLPISRIEVGKI